MVELANIAVLTAKATDLVAKKAPMRGSAIMKDPWIPEDFYRFCERAAHLKAEPVKPAGHAAANSLVQGLIALGFSCATEVVITYIRNHLDKQAQ